MQMVSRVLRVLPIAALMFLILLSTSEARMVNPWSIDRLAKQASLIAVGEVMDVGPAGTASRSEWTTWIQDMNAHVKILRICPSSQASGLAVGDVITLRYERYDMAKTGGLLNGYDFPQLSPGDCCAFPLVKLTQDGKDLWKLIDREDFGLIVPCLKQPPRGPSPTTTKPFLISELANVFALGNPKDIYRGAGYHNNTLWSDAANVGLLHDSIASVVKDNEARWLDIAVITYNSMGTPRPSIAVLKTGKMPEHPWANTVLVAKALSHIPKKDMDKKFITATIKHMDVLPWGPGVTLSQNYASNPLAISLLIKCLGAGDPVAIVVSESVIRANRHKGLLHAAVEASMRLITASGVAPHTGLGTALRLVMEYGSESQFKTVLDVFQESLKEDHDEFFQMWQSLAYSKSKREIAVIRIAITDDTLWPHWQGMRVSDVAAGELQRITGVEFGTGSRDSDAERSAALEKAKEWLAENP